MSAIDPGKLAKGALSAVLREIGVIAPPLKPAADAIANAIDGRSTSTLTVQEQAQIAERLATFERDVIQSDNEVEKAEIASEHWWVWGARPFLLYIAGVGTAALITAVIIGRAVDTGAVAELMVPLWGHAGFYAYQRTKEKIAGSM